ncbi:MAG: elongation factor G, partial [Clostridia bacterium]|nr:elongation factor G [Clostridia bacterium]
MKQFDINKIKSIALLGHGSCGKTTLAESMLFAAGITDRIGKTSDGSAIMDFDAEEKKRSVSVSTAVYQFEYKDNKINLIDAPGLFDFAGGVSEALTAADSAVIVLSGKSGLNVGSQINFDQAKSAGVPVSFFIGKLDSPRAYFYRVISTLTAHYGAVICPVVIPYVEGETVVSYVDLISGKAYKCDGVKYTETDMPQNADITNMRDVMLEAVASVDEALMEKYFGGEEFTAEEIKEALKKGMVSGDICPVFGGINQTGAGVGIALDILADIAPSAADREYKIKNGDALGTTNCNPTAPATAVVFKTIADPFVGKLSYFKVINGSVKADAKLINMRTGEEEKLGKVMWLKAGKQEDADVIPAGDIGSVAKLGSVKTGDTLCFAGSGVEIVAAEFPKSCLSMAVKVLKKGEEEKVSNGLARLCEEDPTLSFGTDKETRELVLSGLGEQHLDVVSSKLKNKFGVEVKLETPKVAYRETIRKKVKVQGRHKKQSGGHGQFGDVWIEFEPCDSIDMVFAENVFGGSVPKNFFPAVETGLRECVKKGTLAGYPVVGLKATLVDGSYHPVDSSEMSFKMAAAVAFKAGIPTANPVLLEPIGTLKVIVPDDVMGDVIGDINKRRG